MDKLSNLISKYTKKYSDNATHVSIACLVDEKDLAVEVFLEPTEFQVNIGSYLKMDKIEGQQIDFDDVSPLLEDLLDSIKGGNVLLYEHRFLGLKAYAIVDAENRSNPMHVLYETLGTSIVRTLGRKRVLGKIRFQDSSEQ